MDIISTVLFWLFNGILYLKEIFFENMLWMLGVGGLFFIFIEDQKEINEQIQEDMRELL